MNTWLNYWDRSYEQIKASVLGRTKTLVPELTDHNESNLFVKMVGIWSGMMEMLGYYLDNQARETHLMTARLYSSALKTAFIEDYRVKSKRAATATVLFTFSSAHVSPIIVPAGTLLATDSGISFRTMQAYTLNVGDTVLIAYVKQVDSTDTLVLGNSDGSAEQAFEIPETAYTDGSGVVTVNAIGWNAKETLGYSNLLSDDCIITMRENSDGLVRPFAVFGDGLAGKIPPIGEEIAVSFERCSGVNGNVNANTLSLVSTLTLPLGITVTATNPDRASGGAEVETLEEIRYRVPRSVRTLMRAVTKQDFKDLAELVSGVARAGVYFDCTTTTVSVYIVPDGGGVASGLLITAVLDYLNARKVIGRNIAVYAAGEVRIIYTIDVRAVAGYSNVTVAQDVANNIVAFQSYLKQEVGGSTQLSDIYEVIENTAGVANSTIVSMVTVPYARPLFGSVVPLIWSRTTNVGSVSTIKWTIAMTSPTTYQLFKSNLFVGTYNVGDALVFDEISFTINAGAYLLGQQWEFYTYPYYGTIVLQEPSILISLLGDVTVNVTGGI